MTEATTISIGIVITLMGAAVSYGVIWAKVENLRKTVDRLEDSFDKLNSQLTIYILKEKI